LNQDDSVSTPASATQQMHVGMPLPTRERYAFRAVALAWVSYDHLVNDSTVPRLVLCILAPVTSSSVQHDAMFGRETR